MNERTSNLHTLQGYQKQRAAMLMFCKRRGHPHEYAEDFASWLVTELLSGRREKQNLRQSYIDYQISIGELKRPSVASSNGYKKTSPQYLEDTPNWHALLERDQSDVPRFLEQLAFHPGLNLRESWLLVDRGAGYLNNELAAFKGCHPTRISQLVGAAIKKIKAIETVQTAREMIRDMPSQLILEVDWIKL